MTSSAETAKPELYVLSDEITVARRPVEASMSDGTVLRGYCYELENAGTSRRRKVQHSSTPLLCLPDELGNTSEHHEFVLKLSALPASPKRIYTVNLRGRGTSDSTNIGDSSASSDADDLISFCDALGLHDVDVLVNGRCALAVFLTAPKRPSLIRQLILNDAGVELDSVGIARQTALRQRAKAPSNWSEAANQLKELRGDQFPSFDESDWSALAKTIWHDADGKPVSNIAKGLTRISNAVDYDSRQPDLWAEFRVLKNRPVLLIRGEHSALVTSEIAKNLLAEHGSMKTIVAPGQGHIPMLHKDDLAEQILEFLTAR